MSTKHRELRAEEENRAREAADTEEQAVVGTETPAQGEVAASGAEAAEQSPQAAHDEAAREAVLQAELAAVREELAEVNDKYLRKLADDANFRKRMAREREDGQRYAVSALLADLVPILDDFDRAISSAEASRDYAVLHDGILLIRRQIGQLLENRYGLAPYSTLGQVFDPNRHEAVATVQADPGDEGVEAMVAEEFLPGYRLHDRILRTAKVRVRMPAIKAPASDAESGGA